MSWDQGVQTREELPEKFLAWADRKIPGGRLEYITWFESERHILYLDYGADGSIKLTFSEAVIA